ncbi:MAG TPA: hypothetical protein VGJ88_01795 [Thermoanaerobaculia bacterium]
MRRRFADPGLALLLALLAAQCAIELAYYRHPLVTDEFYWVGKAQYIATHHRLQPAARESIAAERGERWGTSDWRPQGFPLFVALVSGGDFTDPAGALRLRLTLIMCIGMSVVLLTLYSIVAPFLPIGRRLAAAAILGAAPWPFEGINEIGTDALNTVITTAALLLLWHWCVDRGHGALTLFVASLIAAVPLLLRPEMIVMAPLLIAAALVVRRPSATELLAVVLAFGVIAGAQFAYRLWFTGRPGFYGGLHIENQGAFDWTNTWPGTEKEGYDFVYAVTEGRKAPLPSRAFADEGERARVSAIVTRVTRSGRYTADDDTAFEQLARERKARAPVATFLLRVWHTVHLWVNIENPSPLLDLLANVSRTTRRPILGALVLLRLLILTLAFLSMVRVFGSLRDRAIGNLSALTFLALSFIVSRSLLIGAVLNWKVHRYVLAAWPAMLWCAIAALVDVRVSRLRSAEELAQARADTGPAA